MYIKQSVLLFCLFLTFGCSSQSLVADNLILSGPSSVGVGQEFVVDVLIREETIRGAQFNINFDTEFLTVRQVEAGSLLGDNPLFISDLLQETSTGIKQVVLLRTQRTSPDTSGVLAKVTFIAEQQGTVSLSLDAVTLAQTDSVSIPAITSPLMIIIE